MALGDEYMETALGLVPFNDRFLLTGAGFARPWGGYLAGEFWGLVLGDPRLDQLPRVRSLLHKTMNFEDALAEIEMTARDEFNDADRTGLREATRYAFELHDSNLCLGGTDAPGLLNRFVERFVGDNQTACVFTLNQDLMLERFVTTGDRPRIQMPGLHRHEWWFGQRTSAPWLNKIPKPSTTVTFDVAEFVKQVALSLSYIKLHGSSDWRLAGEEVLVIGGGKEESIRRFPILSMNHALFRTALNARSNARLLVIGYGFGDRHINEMIAHAVENGLGLWIVDPTPPPDLRKRIEENGWGQIWSGLLGYSTRPLDEVLREGTSEWSRLIKGFFGR